MEHEAARVRSDRQAPETGGPCEHWVTGPDPAGQMVRTVMAQTD